MSHRKCKAIMGCTVQQPAKVISRGRQVLVELYSRPDLYANPTVLQAVLEAQLEKAVSAQAATRGGGVIETSKRDSEVEKLFELLKKKLLTWVNGLYEGEREKLMASGFGVSKDPTPKDIPGQPHIKYITDANTGNTFGAKIVLVKKTNPIDEKKEVYTYVVQISKERDNESSYVTVLMTQNQYKLIIPNLERGVEVFFRVARRNARGQSYWSESDRFIPR
jgi:hypothetical protein